MRFGYCCGPLDAPLLKAAGFDYFEWSVPGLLMPLADGAAFEAALAQANAAPLPCEALNCMVPGDLKITGPNADPAKLETYASVMFARAKQAGIQRIVFGSGGARAVPENFSKETARGQIVAFLKRLAPLARDAGVVVVVEPLNPGETNIINSVPEGAEIVREVNDPNIRLLADAYHILVGGEPLENLTRHLGLIAHAHVASRGGRMPPGVEPCAGVQEFLARLRDGGYDGRVSVEAAGFSASNTLVARATMCVWTH